MRENEFKKKLKDELKQKYPGCMFIDTDPNRIQGIPDMIVLWKDRWAALETKRGKKASRQPNQPYYVNKMNDMSFSAFIYPENKEEVLNELERSFKRNARRNSRFS